MGLLNEFEEKEVVKVEESFLEETNLEDFVKSIVKSELSEITDFLKTKTAEYILEQQNSKKLTEKIDRYAETNEVFKDTILSKTEEFSGKFLENLKELKGINENFVEALEKSEFLKNLKKEVAEEISKIQDTKTKFEKEGDKKLREIKENAQETIQLAADKLENYYIFKRFLPWFLTIISVFIMTYNYFSLRSQVREFQIKTEKTQSDIFEIKNILFGNDQFWYSTKDKKAYLDNKAEIKKQKEAEAKNSKK